MYNMYHFGVGGSFLMVIIIIWTLLWKCYSVWTAAKRNEKGWFVALLVLNTVGILDMIYIFGFANKKLSDIKKAAERVFTSKK